MASFFLILISLRHFPQKNKSHFFVLVKVSAPVSLVSHKFWPVSNSSSSCPTQPVSLTREAIELSSWSTRRPQNVLGCGPCWPEAWSNNIASGFPIFWTGFTRKTIFAMGLTQRPQIWSGPDPARVSETGCPDGGWFFEVVWNPKPIWKKISNLRMQITISGES